MIKFLPKKSKKGITLVESVVAVVVLGILASGVLTLLTTGGVKIQEISGESAAYSEATQKMDRVISAISNGSDTYILEDPTGKVYIDVDALKSSVGLPNDVEITTLVSRYNEAEPETAANIRGWYLELTYQEITVKGFASNSEGVFDQ